MPVSTQQSDQQAPATEPLHKKLRAEFATHIAANHPLPANPFQHLPACTIKDIAAEPSAPPKPKSAAVKFALFMLIQQWIYFQIPRTAAKKLCDHIRQFYQIAQRAALDFYGLKDKAVLKLGTFDSNLSRLLSKKMSASKLTVRQMLLCHHQRCKTINPKDAKVCSRCGKSLYQPSHPGSVAQPIEVAAFTSIKEWLQFLLSMPDFKALLEAEFAMSTEAGNVINRM